MRRSSPLVLALALPLLALLLAAPPAVQAAPGEYHQDDRMGFKVRSPRGWTSIPMKVDEKWIVAKFLSDRNHFFTDDTDGWTYEHKPQMTVIAFIAEVVRKRGIEKTETDDGFLLEINNPYKDYEDYMDRTYRGGGWYISEDEEDEVNGIPVRKIEIKVEKLTRTGPKRIVTWIFKTEEVDFAVQFEVLEGAYRKLKGDIHGCLKSFKLVPRTGGSLTPTITGERTKPVDEDELSPEDRKAHRQQTEKVHHDRAVASLTEGWTSKEMGRFLVLNHVDEKYARKVVAHAEAVWDWLDDNFDYIGKGEYVRRPIIRICEDSDEESAFRSGDWFGMGIEIVTHKDTGAGAMSFEFEWVNRRVLAIWFNHRDVDLFSALPPWLDRALEQVLGTARSKGSRLEFKVDDWERDGLREAIRAGKLTPPQELMKLTISDFYEDRHRSKQAAAFLRFLLSSKKRKVKTILRDYLLNLQDVVGEVKQKNKQSGPEAYDPPETEEEEEERFRQRREAWKEKAQELLDQVFERTFADWSEKDWKRLTDQYFKSVD